MRKKDSSLSETVFLSDYPAAKKEYRISDDMQQKWNRLMALREKAQHEYEGLRKEKKIGSNLGAHLTLQYDAALNDAEKELLRMVFGTWDIDFKPTAKEGEAAAAAEPSKQPKCERCWRCIEDVDPATHVCGRCATALKEKK
jgi:isoleucyl-tRNA synthetase